MAQVHQLYQLQLIDSEIRQKKQQLQEVLNAQKETPELLATRQAVQAAKAKVAEWQKKQRALDLEIKSNITENQQTEERLYSGKVKNSKEMTDLQMKIGALQRHRNRLEDEMIETMIALEQAAETHKETQAHLAELKENRRAALGGHKKEQTTLALRINELLGLRKERLALIDANALKKYQAISRKTRDGVAVAMLRVNECQGCLVTVSSQKMKDAREGKLVYCENCGRMLNPAGS